MQIKPDVDASVIDLVGSETESTAVVLAAETLPAAMEPATRAPMNILVVGDWVIDEYWFLVKHNSEISSHTGTVHYRLSNLRNERISDLCGAGHAFRILSEVRRTDENNDYVLHGVGVWNDDDTSYIKHLIHASKKECDAPNAWYRIAPRMCSESDDVNLVTLKPNASTTRVVRQYHHELGGIEQINRVDWELESDHDFLLDTDIDLSRLPEGVDGIVIHDLAKGVVNERLIDLLRKRYPNARWYVRSKDRSLLAPETQQKHWLRNLGDNLELLVIGPELATRMNPWDRWLMNGHVTSVALETAKRLPGKHVVLLSELREVVAIHKDTYVCVPPASHDPVDAVTQLGWTSALFAALVYRFLDSAAALQPAISWALETADDLGHIQIPGQKKLLPPVKRLDPEPLHWKDEQKRWKDSETGCGVIKEPDGSLHLDVWRGMAHLPNYVVCIKKKQEIVSAIARDLRGFKKSGSRLPSVSVLLRADPGAGKTFLAKTLADSFGFAFIRADVSQMIHRDEIFDLFDAIATMQANQKDRVLVFVDEVNTQLEGSGVYGAFLAPLEEGHYVRRGKTFSLKPCAWIFAGTEKSSDHEARPKEKLVDLSSRLTREANIDFASLSLSYENNIGQLWSEAKLEQVYLAAAMIRRFFSDVRYVSYEVLQYFNGLKPSEGSLARRIRKEVASLRDVQYGCITRKNCDFMRDCPPGDDTRVRLDFG